MHTLLPAKEEIVAISQNWIGTKFLYNGRIKKNNNDLGGCDCIGLIFGIAIEAGIFFKGHDPSYVFSQFVYKNIIKKEDALFLLNSYFYKKDFIDLGSILFFYNIGLSHIGIVSCLKNDTWSFIHSYKKAGMVVEQKLCPSWMRYLSGVFSFYKN